MINRILIATDGSPTALKAARYAVYLAKRLKASIIITSVIDERSLITQLLPAETTGWNVMQTIEGYLREAAGRYIEEIQKLCTKNRIRSKPLVITGHPVEDIVKAAKRSRADLIVIGSHGRSAVAAAVMGSVTYGVIHKDTSIPVLVVRR
jgi:nucleotide-binding universal stress UspA family protein